MKRKSKRPHEELIREANVISDSQIADIPWKCNTCYEIDSRRKSCKDKAVLRALEELNILHQRGMFMQEQARYKANIRHALENPLTVMSLIMDGMNPSYSECPHLGKQNTFSKPLKQHIQGVLVHGVGVTFYRTFNNLSKGTDLTIQCLLLSIEKWKLAHPDRQFPETLYIQIGGDSENADHHVHAACEWLVAKRMIKKVVLSSLPTGHTHKDIAATFSHLWRWMRGKTVETVQDLKTGVQDYFRDTALAATVEDIYAIPDYQEFFTPFIDDKFASNTNLIGTQHCFKFEAVDTSQYFPLGVKVSYRAYCSDRVVEIFAKPKDLCITPTGQLTGLEAYTTIGKWYPDKETNTQRPIDGFYILTGMPNAGCHPGEYRPWLAPKPFEDGSAIEIEGTINAVRSYFPLDSSKHQQRKLWEVWIRDFSPGNLSAIEYVREQKNYRIPLRSYLPASVVCNPTWCKGLVKFLSDSDGFEWPPALAACMPSAASTSD